jgi:hypothetical protein
MGYNDKLAAVQRDGKWGYIGTDRAVVSSLTYEHADDFHQGLAQIETNGELCVGGNDGKFAWGPKAGSHGG